MLQTTPKRLIPADAALTYPEPNSWEARWIWCEQPTEGKHDFVYFRKNFQLKSNSKPAYVYVTAEREYELWINGCFLGRGPVLSDPCFKRYDTYEVAKYLTEGTNCLSAIVYHDCTRFRMTSNAEARGFLCQMDIDGKAVVVTDETWLAKRSEAWRGELTYVDDVKWMESYDSRYAPENENAPCRKDATNAIKGL